MATPPSLVSAAASALNSTTSPKSVSVTVQSGDIIVVCGVIADETQVINTPTGGSLTYTLRASLTGVSGTSPAYVWTATATSSTTFSVSCTSTATTQFWGITVYVWRGSNGVGAVNTAQTTGTPSVSLTTTQANSAIVWISGDFNAVDGTSRTWATVNSITPTAGNGLEVAYFTNAAEYTYYSADWSDAGAAGAKSPGLTAPTGQKFSAIAIEIKGTTVVTATAVVSGRTTSVGTGSGRALLDFDATLFDVDDLIARPDVIDSPLDDVLNDYVFASSIFPAPVTLDYTWITQPLAWRPVPPSNSMTASRANGSSATVTNGASIAEYGTYDPGSVQLDTALDADPASLATWVTTYQGIFLQRPPVLTFDLLPRTTTECWRILSVTEGTRITLINTPSTWPAECLSVFVDGVAHVVGIDDRSVAFTCSPLVGQAAGQVGPWFKADTSYTTALLDVAPF